MYFLLILQKSRGNTMANKYQKYHGTKRCPNYNAAVGRAVTKLLTNNPKRQRRPDKAPKRPAMCSTGMDKWLSAQLDCFNVSFSTDVKRPACILLINSNAGAMVFSDSALLVDMRSPDGPSAVNLGKQTVLPVAAVGTIALLLSIPRRRPIPICDNMCCFVAKLDMYKSRVLVIALTIGQLHNYMEWNPEFAREVYSHSVLLFMLD
jgi:hypothetical protein